MPLSAAATAPSNDTWLELLDSARVAIVVRMIISIVTTVVVPMTSSRPTPSSPFTAAVRRAIQRSMSAHIPQPAAEDDRAVARLPEAIEGVVSHVDVDSFVCVAPGADTAEAGG